MYKSKIHKITYSERHLEQGMTLAKISLHCILNEHTSSLKQIEQICKCAYS